MAKSLKVKGTSQSAVTVGLSSRGTLKINEYHPAADSAKNYLAHLGINELSIWQESFASCAIEGNRLAEVCSETLHRMLTGQPVSDRYLLGLAWTIITGMRNEKDKGKTKQGKNKQR